VLRSFCFELSGETRAVFFDLDRLGLLFVSQRANLTALGDIARGHSQAVTAADEEEVEAEGKSPRNNHPGEKDPGNLPVEDIASGKLDRLVIRTQVGNHQRGGKSTATDEQEYCKNNHFSCYLSSKLENKGDLEQVICPRKIHDALAPEQPHDQYDDDDQDDRSCSDVHVQLRFLEVQTVCSSRVVVVVVPAGPDTVVSRLLPEPPNPPHELQKAREMRHATPPTIIKMTPIV
jgi:hypothetical protein